MKPKVIFVAGVHGVGKGSLCKEISSILGYPTYSASDLIRNEKNSAVDHNKIAVDPDKNQDHLIKALNNLTVDKNLIIIDGHFCLQGPDTIIEIPKAVFEEMQLVAIILLIDDPVEICSRLKSRDGKSLHLKTIQALQMREKVRAEHIATNLQTPLICAGFNKNSEVIDHLTKLLH